MPSGVGEALMLGSGFRNEIDNDWCAKEHFNVYFDYITIKLLYQLDSWKEQNGGLKQGTQRYF